MKKCLSLRYLHNAVAIALGIAAILLSVALSRAGIEIARFSTLGYFGIFMFSMIGSATIFLPVPHAAAVFSAGIFFDPFYVGILGGLGGAIGELVGYMIGRTAELPEAMTAKWLPRVESALSKYGGVVVVVLAAIPNPMFDIAGLAAGIARYGVGRFFFLTLAGRTFRSLVLAYAGTMTR